MKLPTFWIDIKGKRHRISKMTDTHILNCLVLLNAILTRRGSRKYVPTKDIDIRYPHLGHEGEYVAAFLIEQAKRGKYML